MGMLFTQVAVCSLQEKTLIVFVLFVHIDYYHHSVLCCCWLGDRKGIQPVKVLPQQFQRVYVWALADPGVTESCVTLEKWAG